MVQSALYLVGFIQFYLVFLGEFELVGGLAFLTDEFGDVSVFNNFLVEWEGFRFFSDLDGVEFLAHWSLELELCIFLF